MPLQIPMIVISLPMVLLFAIVVAVLFSVFLWRKGKTIEAMLVLNALLQVVIILILLFKP